MSASHQPRRSTVRWSLWIGYWVFLFVIMHTPIERTGGIRFEYADKIVHFLLYGTLAWLGAWYFSNRPGKLGIGGLLVWAAIYVAYGALDEYLQQFVGRTTSFFDWLADLLGVLSATTILAVKGRKLSEPDRPV